LQSSLYSKIIIITPKTDYLQTVDENEKVHQLGFQA